jgi:chorismate synthase
MPGVKVRGALVQMGPHKIDRANWDWDEVERKPFFCPDAQTMAEWETSRRHPQGGSSIGAVSKSWPKACRPAWGAPIYGKLDAELAIGPDEHQRGEGRRDRRGSARPN